MNTKDLMTQARFWNQVDVIPESNTDQCWLWLGAKMPNGYGMANSGQSKPILAHRYVAGLTEDIKGKIIQHRCDNPLCVRPDHLQIGTQQNNMRDMFVKNRANKKLDIAKVRDIRTKQLSRKEYALKYNISDYTVGEVQRGTTWSWVT